MLQLCRTCHNEITSGDCIALNNKNVNSRRVRSQLLLCVPELPQDLVKDPVLCSACVSALHVAYTFKSQCLRTEEYIRNYYLETKLRKKSVTLLELYKRVARGSEPSNCLEVEGSVLKTSNIVASSNSDEDTDTESVIGLETFSGYNDIVNGGDDNEDIIKETHDIIHSQAEKDDLASDDEWEKSSLLQLLDAPLQFTRKQFKNSAESSSNKKEYLKKKNLFSNVITNTHSNCNKGMKEMQANDIRLKDLSSQKCFVQLVRIDDVPRLQSETTDSPRGLEDQCGSSDTESSINEKWQESLLTEIAASNITATTVEESFVCNVCEFHTAQRSILETHMRTHSGGQAFVCSICQHPCVHQNALSKHMKIHVGKKPFRCSICYFRTARRRYLESHMTVHTGEKPFICTICDFRTARKSYLKTHMRTHTGEKPFVCTVCEFRFAQSIHLNLHMLTHTGVKPNQCSICDFRTAQQGNLTAHMRTHTGEKPFKCNICEFRATRGNTIKKHLRTHDTRRFHE